MSASLIIGMFWAAWHLPLFYLEGSYQYNLGVGTPDFWSFNAAIFIGSVIYGWLYNASGGVAFAPVIFHALGNLSGEVFLDASPAVSVGLEALVVLVLVASSWNWMSRTIKP